MKTLIVALALLLSISGCNSDPKAAARQQAETAAQTVEVVPVASQKLATVFTLPAQLVPFEAVDIYPKVTGFMDMIRVDRGSRVDKGTYLHMASAAKTPGVVAENDVMVASQTASADQGQVQSAEDNVAAARDALRRVAQLESYLNIYAPFDGIVSTRNLHPGALVGPASGQSGTMPIVQIVYT